MGSETENLKFEAGSFEFTGNQQVIHPDGTISEYLDMGLNWIFESLRLYGYEAEIERILEKDGVQFTVGLLDLTEPDTDGLTYFGCSIIQNLNVSAYKKQLDTSLDMFALQNLKGMPIDPAPTMSVLRRAVPLTGQSQWSKTSPSGFRAYTNFFFCLNSNLITDGVKTSQISTDNVLRYYDGGWRGMTFAQHATGASGAEDFTARAEGDSMRLINARKQLIQTSVNVRFRGSLTPHFTGLFDTHSASFYYAVMVCSPADFRETFNAGDYHKVFNIDYDDSQESYALDINETITLPFTIPIGKVVYGFYSISFPNLSDSAAAQQTAVVVNDSLVTVTASELSLDTVIGAVRYIDILKQCSKQINNTPVDAALFDIGGDHYDNVCYNRALLSMKTANSLALLNSTSPEGSETGQIVYNTNDTITGILPLGLYFWNGENWVSLSSDGEIPDVFLTAFDLPAGDTEGQLANNINPNIEPSGVIYWNGTNWTKLQYAKPFITSMVDAYENAMTIETCSDYEIKDDKILVAEFSEYYSNDEIGAFLIKPSKEFKWSWNPRVMLNNIKLAFDTFETNRLTKNSANDLHTKAEWYVPNDHAFNKFERTIKYIRSGYSAQAMVDIETKTPQTADDNDDKVFIARITDLPEGSFGIVPALLYMSIVDGKQQILNRPSDGSEDDVVINWNSLGFSVGDAMEVTILGVTKSYTVDSFTDSALLLNGVGFTPAITGDKDVEIKYYYTAVQYQTKTDQSYDIIEGLENPDKTPNLDYTLRRIFAAWEGYFKSCGLFKATGRIKNLFYKNNTPLRSKQSGKPVYVEKGDILFSNMTGARIGSKIWDLEVYADYGSVLALLNTYNTISKGFVRCYDLEKIIKGYIQNLEYTWKSGLLKLRLEEKYEPDLITLVYADGILSVNDVPYDLQGNVAWWRISGDSFECFDANQRGISNIRHYSQVSLNGVIYTSIDDLYSALAAL